MMKTDRLKRMLRNGRRAMAVGVLALVGLSANFPAQAAIAPGTVCAMTIPPNTVDFGTVPTPYGLAIGDEIKAVTVTVTINCPTTGGPWHFGMANSVNPKASVGTKVFKTRTPGIGIKIENDKINVPGLGGWTSTVIPSGRSEQKYRIALVKISEEIVPGASIDVLFLFSAFASDIDYPYANEYMTLAPVRIGTPTCRATASSQLIKLPAISVSALRAPGDTAASTPFNLVLDCNGNKDILITLTDLNNIGNTSNNLTLTSGSSATGVKLRILKPDGTPVSYGPDSPVYGSRGQWKVGPAPNGPTRIPMTVQYISTGAVTPGTVDAVATFTLSYQ